MREKSVGQRLQRYRERAGLSRTGLADAAKIHRNTVYLVESGRCKPSWETLSKLAQALRLKGVEKLTGEPGLQRKPLPPLARERCKEVPTSWSVSWVRPSLDGPFLMKTPLGFCPSQTRAHDLARAYVKEHGGSYELEPCFTDLPLELSGS